MPKRLPDSPPKPFKITQELWAMRKEVIDRVHERYKLAFVLSYSKSRRGLGSEIARVGHSDPTGDTLVDREEMRNAVAFAGRKILEACAAIDGADDALSKITETAGKYERLASRAGEIPPAHRVELGRREQQRQIRKPKAS